MFFEGWCYMGRLMIFLMLGIGVSDLVDVVVRLFVSWGSVDLGI